MGKIHLLLKKEEIDGEKLKDQVAVVFDVFLASSVVTAALHFGAKEVIPVFKGDEALQVAKELEQNRCVLVGEHEGRALEGFHLPVPLSLKGSMEGKTMILSTTNGTVAVRKASVANKVYICSLLNGLAVAEKVTADHVDDSLVIICSGSSGSFSLEDFYGAGYFLDCLISREPKAWELTDSAQAAFLFYRGNQHNHHEVLRNTRVGRMLLRSGWEQDLDYVTQRGILSIVPYVEGKNILGSSY